MLFREEGTYFPDVPIIKPEDHLGFCCFISSISVALDRDPCLTVQDENGDRILGDVTMTHQMESENDFEDCSEGIPQDILRKLYVYLSIEKNWNNFMNLWTDFPDDYDKW